MIRASGITQPWILRWQGYRLRYSVDVRHNLGYPIDRSGEVPHLTASGRNITDQQEMRQGLVMPVGDHLNALATRYGEQPVAYASHANCLANPRYVGYANGTLYHLAEEPVYDQPYPSIVSWADGRVTVGDVAFAREMDQPVVFQLLDGRAEDITTRIDFATSGLPLVRHGIRVPIEHISGSFYDTRHVVSPLVVPMDGVNLFVPNTQLQQGLLRKALAGTVRVRLEAKVDKDTTLPLSRSGWLRLAKEQPAALENAAIFLRQRKMLNPEENLSNIEVLLRVGGEIEELLKKALAKADYDVIDVARPLQESEACFLNSHLEIHFRPALYPHNIFVSWADGTCGFVVFPGLSGESGTTLPYAQQYLTGELEVQDALLLDNGGDVRLWYRGRSLVESGQGRQEVRALLALTGAANGTGRHTITIQ